MRRWDRIGVWLSRKQDAATPREEYRHTFRKFRREDGMAISTDDRKASYTAKFKRLKTQYEEGN